MEAMADFSIKHELLQKTTEASFVYLDRFLEKSTSTPAALSNCRIWDRNGKYTLMSLSMCILMISAKYEEVYPPSLSSFAKYSECSLNDFKKLEIIVLQTIN